MITVGEYYFFDKIKEKCDIIFDVGVRCDVHYLERSEGKIFHLFEPNNSFYEGLLKNLNNIVIEHNVITNNFGLGGETGDFIYYHNTQSFMKLVTNYKSDLNNTSIFKLVSFKEYLNNENIDKIDFLKIDTEGSEIDVLYSDLHFLKNNIKYVQFEYTSAWLSSDRHIFIKEIYEELSEYFEFYILKDDKHPISKKYVEEMKDLTPENFNEIDSYMKQGYGFNIALIKRNDKKK